MRKEEIIGSLDAVIAAPDGDYSVAADQLKDVKDRLRDIWEKYPVVTRTQEGGSGYPTYGGTITQIRFASTVRNISLTEQENEVLETVELILREAYYKENPDEPAEESGRVAEPDRPTIGEAATYSGAASAISVAYKPVLLWYALGALIVLAGGYYLVRRYRRKGAP